MFELRFTESARNHFESLLRNPGEAAVLQQVRKQMSYLQMNPRHPSLQTHEYYSIPNPIDKNGKVFEAYAQNKTPGAYRIFWCYGPDKKQITIIAITPHP